MYFISTHSAGVPSNPRQSKDVLLKNSMLLITSTMVKWGGADIILHGGRWENPEGNENPRWSNEKWECLSWSLQANGCVVWVVYKLCQETTASIAILTPPTLKWYSIVIETKQDRAESSWLRWVGTSGNSNSKSYSDTSDTFVKMKSLCGLWLLNWPKNYVNIFSQQS